MRHERREIKQLLADSPSLRSLVPAIIGGNIGQAKAEAAAWLADIGETPRCDIESIGYTEAQIVGDWFP